MLKKVVGWVSHVLWLQPPWIVDVVISGFVGYLIGNAAAEYALSRLPPPPITRDVKTNDQGVSWPLGQPAGLVREEEKKVVIFDPPALELTGVCEYSRVSGSTYEDVLLNICRSTQCVF